MGEAGGRECDACRAGSLAETYPKPTSDTSCWLSGWLGGSANGDVEFPVAPTGECTDVASANRAVRGLLNDVVPVSSEELWFSEATPGCEVTAMG
jgi:hypothetical protein